MRKVINFPIRIVLADEDITWNCLDGIYRLSEETGWWDNKAIYIWHPGVSSLRKLGILAHELFEKFLVKLKIPDNYAHNFANIIEFILSLGQAKIEWRKL